METYLRSQTCEHCSTTFEVPASRPLTWKRYCTKTCQRAAVEVRRLVVVKAGKERACLSCGQGFHSRYRSNAVYCRRLCRPSLGGGNR